MSLVPLDIRCCCEKCGQPIRAGSKIPGLYFVGREVYFGERSVTLTVRERQVLETIVSAYPEPYNAERLFDKLWSAGTCRSIVHVYINRLRGKLNFGIQIKSVRGIGYRVSVENVA